MKHLFLSHAWAPCLGVLATLLAGPTAGFSTSQPLLDTAAVVRRPPVTAGVKKLHSRLVVAKPKPARALTTSPALLPPDRLAAALPPAAPAQPQFVTLRGVVIRPTGRPCPGASVYEARAPRQVVVTDAQGAFTLPVLAGAAALLRVEYFGEGSSRVEIPVPTIDLLHITLGQ